ncbi:MAG: RimK family alpha-L-glutamate ligase [Candidatus Shapirobacteria bacterium]
MDKKIIAFTMSPKQSQFEVDRLAQEGKKLGVEVEKVNYRDLTFEVNNQKPRVYINSIERNGENTLGCWFRVAGTKSGKYVEGRNMLIRLKQNEMFCVNAGSYLGWPRMGKISQHAVFVEAGIPVVPTAIFYERSQVKSLKVESPKSFGEWDFPIITKHERGYQGKSVRKLENWEEVEKWLNKIDEKNLGMFLWQKFLPGGWDLRVIVLDGKVLGAMKRTASGDEFRSNYSLGGAVEKWELSDEDTKLAEKVAKVCGLDYCGVDIMKSKKPESPKSEESVVLEVNRQCQFKGFEEATGINVARAVVDMIRKRG